MGVASHRALVLGHRSGGPPPRRSAGRRVGDVHPGPNGKIVFASRPRRRCRRRHEARIFVADYPGGTPVQVTTLPTGTNIQHRHPNWSPDHSKIVYAAGTAFNANRNYALWIIDLATGSQTQFVAAADGQDRPTWSPDGTRDRLRLRRQPLREERHHRHRDPAHQRQRRRRAPGVEPGRQHAVLQPRRGQAARTSTSSARSRSATADFVAGAGGVDDWQPAVSPDGARLCYTKGPQNDGADLFTVNVANPTSAVAFTAEMGVGELNCAWSPDGTRVLYTQGRILDGRPRTRAPRTAAIPQKLTSMDVDNHFDGNADWATNFSPTCDAKDAQRKAQRVRDDRALVHGPGLRFRRRGAAPAAARQRRDGDRRATGSTGTSARSLAEAT